MTRSVAYGLTFCAHLAVTVGAWASAGRHPATYLHDVRTEVITPHVTWLKPNAHGKPKVLFLVHRPRGLMRDVVELWQRMDLDYAVYSFVKPERERDYWEANLDRSRTSERMAEAVATCSRPYDAIVLLGFDFKTLPKEAQYYLLRQVKAGAGLVGVHSRLPWKFRADPAGAPRIAAGIPLSALPRYAMPDHLKRFGVARWQDLPRRVAETYRFKQGRIAYIRPPGLGWEPEDWTNANYHYALYIKALQWVLPSLTPSVQWTAMPEGAELKRADLPKRLTVRAASSAGKPTDWTLEVAVRGRFGTERGRHKQALRLEPGDNTLAVAVPKLPAGRHFVDLWVRNAKGVEQFGSFGVHVSSADAIEKACLDPAFCEPDTKSISVGVDFSRPLKSAGVVRVRATDTYGRCVEQVEAQVGPGAREAQVTLDLRRVRALAQWVRIELTRGGEPIDQIQTLLVVRRRAPDEYQAVLWGGVEGGLFGLHQLRRQRATGFNVSLVSVRGDGSTARFAALADMQLMVYATRIGGVSDGKNGKFSNSAYMTKATTAMVDKCRNSAPYGVFVYSLGDECFTGPMDQPLAGTDLPAFRTFLKTRYADLAELNRVWSTTYKSWDEIVPVDWKTATGATFYPQKHERMAFIEHLYAKAMHDHADALKKMDPRARVGAEGSQPGDLELTLRGLDMWGPYAHRRIDVLLASLAPRTLVRGMWWGGYHGGMVPRWKKVDRFWRMVMEGVCNTNYFFDGHLGHHESNCGADLSWADYFKKEIPQLRQIYETPGPLLAKANMLNFGVALLWSQASEHTARFYAPYAAPSVEATAQFSALDANGVNYRFITTRQLTAKGIDPAKVKVLLLPMCTALGTAQARRLRQYVEAGGVLLATGSAGVMDGHCRLLAKGQLDDLIGIKRTGLATMVRQALTGTGRLLGRTLKLDVGKAVVDTSIRADGADVVLRAGDVPVIVQRSVGKGVVVYLNTAISHFVSRGTAGTRAARDVVAAVLHQARIDPLFDLRPLGAARAYSFRLGKTTLVSLVHETTAKPRPVVLALGRPAWVFDVLAGKALGRTGTVAVAVKDPPFGLYALLPDKPAPPKLTVPGMARAGDVVPVTVALPSAAGRLVRLDVHQPDGTWVRVYRRFLTLSGDKASTVIPLALNDPAGTWTVRATDLATGRTDQAKTEVRQ